jgi:competence ComEA-like helix-hairpin-helix protein
MPPVSSERAPQVVYSASLEEVEDEAQGSLKVNINTADTDELDELPEVGPATAESIIEYRRTNGMFRSVEELASMRNCKTSDLRFRAKLGVNSSESLELTRV